MPPTVIVMEWFEKIRAKRKAMGWSQDDLAEAVGISQAAILKIEKGGVRKSRYTALIASRLGIPTEEVADGVIESVAAPEGRNKIIGYGAELYRRPEIAEMLGFGGEIPVFASAEAGDGQLLIGPERIGTIPRPDPLQGIPEGFGVYVVGESMEPEYEAGDTALVHPKLPVVPNTTCIFYASDPNRPEQQRAMIKRLVKITRESWLVRQWNPPLGEPGEFALPRSEWPVCWRVVGKFSRR